MMVALGLISAITMAILYRKQNKKRSAQVANGVTLSHDEIADLGDRAPTYQYAL